MSEFYFCVFCDTVVLSLDELPIHLSQHLKPEDTEDRELTEAERNFIQSLVEYQWRLSRSMALMPKELPEDTVQTLLIGCPTCDAIIRCYDLINNRDNKNQCRCGRDSPELLLFRCVRCRHKCHMDCSPKAAEDLCIDCTSKSFNISYLNCFQFQEQRHHCYTHLNYYPFVCHIRGDRSPPFDRICGRRLYLISDCAKHLKSAHKFCLDAFVDKSELCAQHFELAAIDKLDDLINARLSSKPIIDIDPIFDSSALTVNDDGLWTMETKFDVGLARSQFLMDDVCKDEIPFDQSFQYSSERLVNTERRVSTEGMSSAQRKVSTESRVDTDKKVGTEAMSTSQRRVSTGELVSKRQSQHNSQYFPKKRRKSGNGDLLTACRKRATTLTQMLSHLNQSSGTTAKESGSVSGLASDGLTQDSVDSVISRDLSEVFDVTHRHSYDNWFTQTKPVKIPYFPQKDDEVYYLPYGHHLYKEEVMKTGLYNQSNVNYTIRFYTHHKILSRVAKIDFMFKMCRRTQTVIRIIYVTLRPMDGNYGQIIHVKYHDVQGVVDFIVLREHYEASLAKEWDVGHQFKSIVDDHYWFGTVIGLNDADYCQISMFKKYQIRWHSNNGVDLLSPWDMEELADSDLLSDKTVAVSVTDSDRKQFFERRPEEWPGFNEKRELNRLSKGLRMIYQMDKTSEFPILQDVTDSRYLDKILYPVDMKTFIARVENHYYRRHSAIKYDMKFMEANIRKLVKSVKRDPVYRFDEQIAKRLKYHTKFVTALCLVFADTHDCTNPNDLYPHIDDYLETHDVKCYSAKRVHLNTRKKYPNLLPVPHKRLAKPQSFGTSAKTLKTFKALRNTKLPYYKSSGKEMNITCKGMNSTGKGLYSTGKGLNSSGKELNITASTSQAVHQYKPSSSCAIAGPSTDAKPTNEEVVVAHSERQSQYLSDYDLESEEEYALYSSDVSRSENDYIFESSDDSDNSDVDPDYKMTNYHKNNFYH